MEIKSFVTVRIMRFLFYFVHPSKYNVFRATINILKEKGHSVDVLINSKDVLEDLVRNEGWQYKNIFPEGRKIEALPRLLGATYNALRTVIRLQRYIGNNHYDLFITDDLLVVNGRMNRVASILFQDDDVSYVPETLLLMFFANHVFSPSVTNIGVFHNKSLQFFGYKELGALHPRRFVPDEAVVRRVHNSDRPFYLIRLVSLKALHDKDKKGLSNEDVHHLIRVLSAHGRVYICAERELTTDLEPYRLNINPNDLPHFLHYTSFLISDSQTMSAEAGVLGTPYIRFNDFVGKVSYLKELEEKYGLGVGIQTHDKNRLFEEVEKLLHTENLKSEWANRRRSMLRDKIDLTALMTWLFEGYPDSASILLRDPDYQMRFCVPEAV